MHMRSILQRQCSFVYAHLLLYLQHMQLKLLRNDTMP